MNDGQEDIHQCRAGEGAVREAERGSEEPAASADRREDGEVTEREREAEQEMQDVTQRLRPLAVGDQDGAEQER